MPRHPQIVLRYPCFPHTTFVDGGPWALYWKISVGLHMHIAILCEKKMHVHSTAGWPLLPWLDMSWALVQHEKGRRVVRRTVLKVPVTGSYFFPVGFGISYVKESTVILHWQGMHILMPIPLLLLFSLLWLQKSMDPAAIVVFWWKEKKWIELTARKGWDNCWHKWNDHICAGNQPWWISPYSFLFDG